MLSVSKSNINSAIGFRSDINVLRAVSVAAVVLYHFKVPYFSGGFVGVDVFFVISGYLMTRIISEKVYSGNFCLFDFYFDRACRIMPALIFVCLAFMLYGWFFLYPQEYKQLAREVLAATSFLSNVLYFKTNGYFDPAAEEMYLLHTWSLAVEWQFYLAYPIVFVALNKFFGRLVTKYILLLSFLGAFVFSCLSTGYDANMAFYLLPARIWEMLAGGMVYLFSIYVCGEKKQVVVQYLGFLVILMGVFFVDNTVPWPGFLAVIPVFGAVLFISAQSQSTAISNSRFLNVIGSSSYSIYLWHWPICLVFITYGVGESYFWICFGIAISVVLGFISYRTIESYFISLKKISGLGGRSIFVAALLLCAAIPSGVIYKENGVESASRSVNSGDRSEFLSRYKNLHESGLEQAYMFQCDFYDHTEKNAKPSIDPNCTSLNSAPSVRGLAFLWGDSHAQALSLGLRSKLPETYTLLQVATSGCPPSLTLNPRTSKINNNCELSNKYALQEIDRLNPDVVFLAQSKFHEEVDWREISGYLKSKGVGNVVLIGPVPQYKPSLPISFVRYGWEPRVEYLSNGLDFSTIRSDEALKRKASGGEEGFLYVSLIDALCKPDIGCKVVVGGNSDDLLLVDSSHLSPTGSIAVGDIIISKIRNIIDDPLN